MVFILFFVLRDNENDLLYLSESFEYYFEFYASS